MFTLSFISIILKLLNAMDAFSHEMRSRFHTKKYNNNFELKTNVKKIIIILPYKRNADCTSKNRLSEKVKHTELYKFSGRLAGEY